VTAAADSALRDAAAEALGAGGSVAHDPWTTFTPYPAPFLSRHGIWALDHESEDSSLWLFLGWAAGERARLLTGRPDEFVAMAHDDGVDLRAPEQAIAYALAYLHTTRPAAPLTTVLRSLDDLPAVPAPDTGERLRLAALARRRGGDFAPAATALPGGGHAVTVHVARDRDLVRARLLLSPAGDVEVAEDTLEADLPLQAAGLG